ncbi:MAG: glycine--tRNA ligase subunit beta [Burkholderiales bacterium]
MSAATLLVELFTEELPPKALKGLGEAFAGTLVEGLRARGLLTSGSVATPYATPRRLAVAVTDVRPVAPDAEVVEKLMPAKVAFGPDGEPTEALRKKLGALGRGHLATREPEAADGPDRRYTASDGKADYVWLRSLAKGAPLARALAEALADTIVRLPIPKVMSYAGPGSYYNDEKFVRPAHRLVALHGTSVVPVAALGLAAGNATLGHRFLSHQPLTLASADAYAPTLEAEGKVIPSFAARRATMVVQLEGAAGNATPIMPDALLDEVTALVEWPVVYAGAFDAAFLAVPQECLILTMQLNQRYFALADDAGRLTNRFLLVSNLETRDPSAIVAGNERVLRARLADAKFFFDQDRRQRLESRVDRLRSVVHHNKLGSQAERVDRLRFLATRIAPLVGADAALADRAARLAKADLLTDMVGEFPELQGLMGRYYAEHDGEPPAVAAAIEQHYWPKAAGDRLPDAPVAQAVALADKLESLAGMFGIGQVPTGDKDPFGLRRAALGVIRILVERDQRVSLAALVDLAFDAFDAVPTVKSDPAALLDFIYDRLRGYLREQGYTANQVAAVLDARPDAIADLPARLAAVQAFAALPEAAALSAANKRIVNILKKSGAEAATAVDHSRLADGAEHDLYLAFQRLTPQVEADYGSGDFTGALRALATAKPAVDRFFDDVMVMADDPAIRANRLALLRGVAATMNRVADISKLA